MDNEATVAGRGKEILLPPQGNPFKKEYASEEPRDLGPNEVAARFGKSAGPAAAEVTGDEPKDLGPDDIAALFPSSPDDRNRIPGAADESTTDGGASGMTPEEEAAIHAANESPAPSRQKKVISARASAGMLAKHAAVRDGDINLGAFDPDAPIERPQWMGKTDIDLAAFNPDVPVGETTPRTTEAPLPETIAPLDAASFKADALPADSTSAPASIDAWLAAPAVPEPVMTAPSVGFKPVDPFAPVVPEAIPVDSAVTTTPPAPTVTTPAAPPTAPAKPAKASDILSEALEGTKDLGTEPTESVIEDEQMIDKLITDERIEQIWSRIENAEKMAVEDDNSLPTQRNKNFENLKVARNLLLGGRKNYEDALRYVVEVEADLRYAARVRRWSYSWGTLILFYELLWLAVLILGVLSSGQLATRFASSGILEQGFWLALWITILSGGIGGVSKSVVSLATHITKQDFDTQHRMWYYSSPLIGAIMGIFVFLTSQVGLFALSAGSGSGSNAGFVVYVIAWLVGFQQNLVWELVERAKKLVLPEKEKEPISE